VIITFTPLLGMSKVVMRFWQPDPADKGARNRCITQMNIQEVAAEKHSHISQKDVEDWCSQYSAHELKARTEGIPMLGSGPVFSDIPEERITCDPFPIPQYWKRIQGIDFGWGDHPTASVSIAIDPETQILYLYAAYKSTETGIAYHAQNIKKRGNIPMAWPHDGLTKDKSSGIQIAQLYRNEGVKMLKNHAQFLGKRQNGLEASVSDLYDRMKSGRFKVFSIFQDWFGEFRIYHRKDGVIKAIYDDLISATRYAVMMERYAMPFQPLPEKRGRYESDTNYKSTSWMSI
jgi:hypothetical protein